MNRIRDRIAREEGSTLPLILVYALIALVLILVVTAITSLYIERKRLFTVADSLALVGAEAYDVSDDTALMPTLTDADVSDAVNSYLSERDTERFEDFSIDRVGAPDARTAAVTVSAQWHPPLIGPVLPASLRLSVTAHARGVLW